MPLGAGNDEFLGGLFFKPKLALRARILCRAAGPLALVTMGILGRPGPVTVSPWRTEPVMVGPWRPEPVTVGSVRATASITIGAKGDLSSALS